MIGAINTTCQLCSDVTVQTIKDSKASWIYLNSVMTSSNHIPNGISVCLIWHLALQRIYSCNQVKHTNQCSNTDKTTTYGRLGMYLFVNMTHLFFVWNPFQPNHISKNSLCRTQYDFPNQPLMQFNTKMSGMYMYLQGILLSRWTEYSFLLIGDKLVFMTNLLYCICVQTFNALHILGTTILNFGAHLWKMECI